MIDATTDLRAIVEKTPAPRPDRLAGERLIELEGGSPNAILDLAASLLAGPVQGLPTDRRPCASREWPCWPH
jgi:hypothetical protein